jgi:chemotaxis protein methyltransferase CheR
MKSCLWARWENGRWKSSAREGRGFDFMSVSKADFKFFQDLVRKRSAIVIDNGKEAMVEARLTPILFQRGIPNLEALIQLLRAQPAGPLHDVVQDVLATHETLFFRDALPYDALRKTIVPELMAKRQAAKTLRIWSGACSTGQEPYSVAMLLRRHFPALATAWKLDILGTDLSGFMIEKAAAGYFTQNQVERGLPPGMLEAYFDRQGDLWRIRPEIRKMVDYRPMNLAGPWDLRGHFDIILLRYVLIYFDAEMRKEILRKAVDHLAPGGYLMTGGIEGGITPPPGLQSIVVEKTLFYRSAG